MVYWVVADILTRCFQISTKTGSPEKGNCYCGWGFERKYA